MEQAWSDSIGRFFAGIFGIVLTGVGLWIGWELLTATEKIPFGLHAALVAVSLGSLVVYIAYDPTGVR